VNTNGKKSVSAVVACVHFVVCSLQLPLAAQEVLSNDSVVTAPAETVADSGCFADSSSTGEGLRNDTTANYPKEHSTGADSPVVSDTAKNSGYFGGDHRPVQSVGRGVAVGSATVTKTRKMLIDTSAFEEARVQDSIAAAIRDSSEASKRDSAQAQNNEPAVRPGTKGKVIAGIVSAAVIGAAGVVLYLKSNGAAPDAEKQRIPPPPDPPGL